MVVSNQRAPEAFPVQTVRGHQPTHLNMATMKREFAAGICNSDKTRAQGHVQHNPSAPPPLPLGDADVEW